VDFHVMTRLATVCALLLGGAARADLFSPGELTKPHATLEGLSQCTKCHPAGGQLSQEMCLNCHTELQPRLNKGLGLHGHIASDKRNCETCHHEHRGLDFKLIDWGQGGLKGFKHERSGWPLKGKHADVKCADCHEKRLILWPTALKLLATRPETYLGVGTACSDCHFDEHRGQQKEDCEYCHNEKAWKPTPGFNHDDTEYPLKGKHIKVKCTACHDTEKDGEAHGFPEPKGETFLRFAPVAHKSCLDCHKDVHEGRFGLRCASCHTVDGWHIIRNASQERQFHEKTRFPLKGAHLDVECRSCHGPFPGQNAKFKNLAFKLCGDCHPDGHEGQLTVNGKTPDCETCHTEASFQPPKYALAEHGKTRYPLEGAHQVVPCASCHPQTPALKTKVPKPVLVDLHRRKRAELFSMAQFDYSKPLERCETCHEDAHDGQFKDRRCDACHVLASFTKKVKFDHQKDSKYPLTGAHVKVDCDKCHFAATKKDVVRYRPIEAKCQSCHSDPHVAQFAGKTCEGCHVDDSWKKLLFKHEPPFTFFLLDGQHAKAKCEACHRVIAFGGQAKAVQYKPLPSTCEGCHSDFHQGAFKGFEP
jgi:hypothetical protein